MSNQLPSGGPNPFLAVSKFIGNKYGQNVRQARDVHQESNIYNALAMHAANFQATTKAASQSARLQEKAKVSEDARRTNFFESLHGKAEPGKPVSFKHGDVQASYTPKIPKPSTPGRVPVKKNRGGKRPQ
jgi:hypothetical protein